MDRRTVADLAWTRLVDNAFDVLARANGARLSGGVVKEN